jgi:pescadillo
LIKLLL